MYKYTEIYFIVINILFTLVSFELVIKKVKRTIVNNQYDEEKVTIPNKKAPAAPLTVSDFFRRL